MLADFLTARNTEGEILARLPYVPCQAGVGIILNMQSPLEIAVAKRLKAIRAEVGRDPPAMAEWLEVGRTRYLNWERADNLPSELAMMLLCEKTGVTLDYLYRGKLAGVPMRLAIRLTARELGQDPDAPGFEVNSPSLMASLATHMA